MPIDIVGTEAYTSGAIQKPVNKDSGNVVFTTIEDFMERLATHSHTGADSKKISLNIEKDNAEFVSGVDFTWTLSSTGRYRAQLPVVVGVDFSTTLRRFFHNDGADWIEFIPTIEQISESSYYIYTNDNSWNIKVVTI